MHDLHGRTVTVEDVAHKLNIDGKQAALLAQAPSLLIALKAARGVLLLAAEGDGNEDYWNEGGAGHRVYFQVVQAIDTAEKA